MVRVLEPECFDSLGNSPPVWFGAADRLLKSASVLWDRQHTIPHGIWVALMLRGYAIENLMKGLWIQAGNKVATDGTFKNIPNLHAHDLVAINNRLELDASQERTNVLHALSTSVRYLGRYPIPRNHQQMALHTKEEPDPKSLWCSEYESRFWLILKDLASRYEFLSQLPSSFLDDVTNETWKQPWSPPDSH